ncbi:Beta-glucosidase 24 [Apostasia shenzhenica]|uniref:Beta-glucosidase 24 n=1 Tax=Apostasia shenzhenica TaxID=1088818 RepID=A0A2I0A9A2_9ASPA|nr:Beta-glucosidase 24 [Apostasia shenzhenica]
MAVSLANTTMASFCSPAAVPRSTAAPGFGKKMVNVPRSRNPSRRTAAVCSAGVVSDVHAGFPPDFAFGAASSAYQVEGATKEGGRGPSIWDTFCEQHPEKIADGSNGDPGAGSYWLYKEDVKRLAEMGADVYRFSIAWPRILPDGRGKPNEEGIQYYKNLIQELLDHGIEPFVTLFHWDVPQKLENEYGGFLSKRIVEDYKNFVDVCFENFGDKVKHWITVNEPLTFCGGGYGSGALAPGHCTPDLVYQGQVLECPVGDSLREPYMVGHNLLLAHAEAYKLYNEKYRSKQGGKVGITLVTNWYVPYDDTILDKEAQQRALESNLGWFMDPIKFGDYPFSMRSLVRERLPSFTEEESNKLKDSFDFLGLNYYTARYARNRVFDVNYQPQMYSDDARFDTLVDKNGVPIGYAETNSWVNVYPRGLRDLLLYVKERYSDPEIYITENGVMELTNNTTNAQPQSNLSTNFLQGVENHDIYRSQYHANHLQELVEAMRNGVKLKGYFAWSLLDSFEWSSGYTSRFGLHYVNNSSYNKKSNDHHPNLERVPKQSAIWYKWFLNVARAPLPVENESAAGSGNQTSNGSVNPAGSGGQSSNGSVTPAQSSTPTSNIKA